MTFVTPEELAALENLRVLFIGFLPGLSLLIYDILLTTTREITHVWLAPKTLFNILYLFQRYLPFIDVLLIGVPPLIAHLPKQTCLVLNYLGFAFFATGLALTEAVLTMRTWAVCKGNDSSKLKYALLSIYGVVWTTVGATAAVAFTHGDAAIIYGEEKRCLVTHGNALVSLPLVLLLCYDFMLFTIMANAAWKSYKLGVSRTMFRAIFVNGFIYYIYIFTLNLASISVILADRFVHSSTDGSDSTANADLDTVSAATFIIPALLRITHSAITARVVLDIKSVVSGSRVNRMQDLELTTLSFSTGTSTGSGRAGPGNG